MVENKRRVPGPLSRKKGHPPSTRPGPASIPVVGSATEADSDQEVIAIRGAREHNLKNISVDLPRGKFVVVTGISGSGKSTLAFDLVFAEGQRRFLDAMSAYARQFVEQLSRPDVDLIAGLPPTVSIEQTTSRGGGKSTVATVTEIHHFIRLLYARIGTQYCPDCDVPVEPQSRDEVRRTLGLEAKRRGTLRLLAPIIRNRKGFHSEIAAWAAQHGYVELRADGKLYDSKKPFRLDRFQEHDVEVVVGSFGRAGLGRASNGRSAAALVDTALRVGKGVIYALDSTGKTTVHSTERACPKCSRSFAPLDPKNFSYNSSQGWCPKCRGFGELFHLPDVERGANADAVEESWWRWASEREECPECHGARLRPEARAVRFELGPTARPTLDDIARLSVDSAGALFKDISLSGRAAEIARDILPEIGERLKFLRLVGLGYLQLGRSIITLSGGEAQRIRLAAQLGSNLSGVLYVLDEPTIGLHNRDNERLLDALAQLKARGNTLLVVEHDEETMRRADYIVDLGPGAGVNGGHVVAAGTLAELMAHTDSLTGRGLRELAVKNYPTRGQRRPVRALGNSPTPRAPDDYLILTHVARNNLQDVTLRIPLGRFSVVTGVSGSGKSTLIKDCLYPAVAAALAGKAFSDPIGGKLSGWKTLTAIHEVDQTPIGRTPRSTPATYVGFFDDIRQLFASTTEAKLRGYTASRVSFNSTQGRCPQCEGAGAVKLEMNFLPTAHVKCDVCDGRRFNPATLDVLWNGKSIADILNLSVAEALAFFASHHRLRRPLQALSDTGLDYLTLGQTSPTLSGGEAQRIKLVTHLLSGLKAVAVSVENADLESLSRAKGASARRPAKQDLFILEEPTIGLHFQDVRRLVEVIQRLVEAGHTVVVIEHNLDLIAEADWVIDLGPEAGDGGGQIVAEGTPEQVARTQHGHTGRYLRQLLRL